MVRATERVGNERLRAGKAALPRRLVAPPRPRLRRTAGRGGCAAKQPGVVGLGEAAAPQSSQEQAVRRGRLRRKSSRE